jgi:hypothetical protein
MPIAFPNSPTNGQTVTINNVVYAWNATTSTWDLVASTPADAGFSPFLLMGA